MGSLPNPLPQEDSLVKNPDFEMDSAKLVVLRLGHRTWLGDQLGFRTYKEVGVSTGVEVDAINLSRKDILGGCVLATL